MRIGRGILTAAVVGSLILTPGIAHAQPQPPVVAEDAPAADPVATAVRVELPVIGSRSLYIVGQEAPVSATVTAVPQEGQDPASVAGTAIAGTVEFFDGEVSLGSAPVAGDGSGAVVSLETDLWPAGGARGISAVFTPEEGSDLAPSTSSPQLYRVVDTTRMVPDIELDGTVASELTDASLEWTIANIWFSNFEVGFVRTVLGGPVTLPDIPDPGADASIPEKQAYYTRPFTFSEGTGVRDAKGDRVISYTGGARLTSGSAPRWDFVDPQVHLAANGDGYITAEVSGRYILGAEVFAYGPQRVTVATFSGAEISPDRNGRVQAEIELNWEGQAMGAGTWAHDYNDSFPNEFLSLLHPLVNLFFARSAVATDESKIPHPITLTFTDTALAEPSAPVKFIDVTKSHKFYTQIQWMAQNKITTGTKTPKGLAYQPKKATSREAMAAFLYRMYADDDYVAPKKSPFVDVKTSHKFYTQIAWMYEEGISTGTKQKKGLPKYEPKAGTSREAMAAFLYRAENVKGFKAPSKSPFVDVKKSDKFYTQIAWMAAEGISTGTKQKKGLPKYEPKASTSREAMSAFLYRIAN